MQGCLINWAIGILNLILSDGQRVYRLIETFTIRPKPVAGHMRWLYQSLSGPFNSAKNWLIMGRVASQPHVVAGYCDKDY